MTSTTSTHSPHDPEHAAEAPYQGIREAIEASPLARALPTLRERAEAIREAERAREALQTADLRDTLARLQRRAAESTARRRSLPCHDRVEAGDVTGAADACGAVGAYRECEWRGYPEWCAWERDRQTYADAERHIKAAGIPPILAARLLAGIAGRRESGARVPVVEYEPTDALRVVRAYLTRCQCGVQLLDGTMVPMTGANWCLVLSGDADAGKSFAAAYALARYGGVWTSAPQYESPRFDPPLDATLVVVDDAGTEYVGESRYATGRIAALLAHRHERCLPTIVTTNLRRRRTSPDEPEQLAERYGARLDSRLREGGVVVALRPVGLRGAGK